MHHETSPTTPSPVPAVGLPELHEVKKIEDMSPAQLDELPYGAIKLDRQGTIIAYNLAEANISGRTKERVIGKNFFTEVAPCTNVQAFAGRFRDGVDNEDLNQVFPYVFSFEMAPTEVWIRLFYSQDSEAAWVFVARKEPE